MHVRYVYYERQWHNIHANNVSLAYTKKNKFLIIL